MLPQWMLWILLKQWHRWQFIPSGWRMLTSDTSKTECFCLLNQMSCSPMHQGLRRWCAGYGASEFSTTGQCALHLNNGCAWWAPVDGHWQTVLQRLHTQEWAPGAMVDFAQFDLQSPREIWISTLPFTVYTASTVVITVSFTVCYQLTIMTVVTGD